MDNKQLMLYICFLLASVFSSCSGSKSNQDESGLLDRCDVIATQEITNGDTIISCNLSAAKLVARIPLSMFVDSLNVVKLDGKEEALVGRGYSTISSNYIGIRESNVPYKLFTSQGKFIGNVGGVGQGPGEYTLIYSSQIDEQNNRIYLLPWTSQSVLAYDLNGQYLESIPLAYKGHKGHIHVNTVKKQVAVVQLVFEEVDDAPVCWLQDWEGNVIHEKRVAHMQVSPDYSNEIYAHKRNADHILFSFLQALPKEDSLYVYSQQTNELTPVFTAKFADDIPLHHYLAFSDFYVTDIYGKNTNPNIPYTSVVVDRIIVDKNTLKGCHFKLVNNFLGGIHLEERLDECGYTLDDTGFTMCMDSGVLLELIEERLQEKNIPAKDRQFLETWKNQISEDDNNYVIYGKIRC